MKSKLHAWNEDHLDDYSVKYILHELDEKVGADWNVWILLRFLIKSLGWNAMGAEIILYKRLSIILVRYWINHFKTRENKNCDYIKIGL